MNEVLSVAVVMTATLFFVYLRAYKVLRNKPPVAKKGTKQVCKKVQKISRKIVYLGFWGCHIIWYNNRQRNCGYFHYHTVVHGTEENNNTRYFCRTKTPEIGIMLYL